MYKVVNTMKPVRDIYRQQLIDQGIPEATLKSLEDKARGEMEVAYEKSKTLNFDKEDWMTEEWAKIKSVDHSKYTGVEMESLIKIGHEITKLPEDGTFHPQLVKIFKARE
jgi:2-oxoglutarate dehydrogenase complex dehydrogenase (E1) component-like enzyme